MVHQENTFTSLEGNTRTITTLEKIKPSAQAGFITGALPSLTLLPEIHEQPAINQGRHITNMSTMST